MSKRPSLTDQQMFAQRLHMLLRAGVPLLAAVRLLAGNSTAAQMSRTASIVSARLVSGVGVAEAIQAAGLAHDAWVCGILEAGEASGALTEHVGFWSEHLAALQRARKQVQNALVYPLMVFSLVCLQVVFLCWFVLPRLLPLFTQLHYRMPLPTRILLFGYQQVRAYWWVYVIAGGIIVLVCRRLIQIPRVQRLAVWVVHRLPVWGEWYRTRQTVLISRSLGVLLRAGVPLLAALSLTERIVVAAEYRQLVGELSAAVQAGQPLALVLGRMRMLVAPEFIDLITTGEESGQLGEACMQAAAVLQERAQFLMQRLVALSEPALLLCVAGGVGFVAVAIILPLYAVTQTIHY